MSCRKSVLTGDATVTRIRNADVPAELVEYINGRYYVRRSNLLAFAEALGLRLKHRSAA